ncbi:MAG: flagellar hook-basal body complex protein FliE [Bryobacterales bacterium]|jgi:flagellar hook-basal body complex protein FliE|nr:flagellar hook-basal body complex protein FliE [Bryobacterales bacterium]
MAISPISGLSAGVPAANPLLRREPAGPTFADALSDAVGRVEAFHRTAEARTERFLAGESEDLHGTILATQQAELAFELFLQVRNKVVQAYQEVMRAPV